MRMSLETKEVTKVRRERLGKVFRVDSQLLQFGIESGSLQTEVICGSARATDRASCLSESP